MKQVPALSIRQPWAELILSGNKSIELRSWTTSYRGWLWIHAASKSDPALERTYGLTNLFKGGFVGGVNLAAIVLLDKWRWELWKDKHLDSHYHRSIFAWILHAPRRLNMPIPAKGQVNLFHLPDYLEEQLYKSLQ
jgi:hypothetical protein